MLAQGKYQVVFISPNGIRWHVYHDSPFVKYLRWAIRGIAREEEYVATGHK